jgi:CPA2 family monovalent cation:H+ antiporter-2
MTEIFLLAGLFLFAGTLMVPIATKLKLGSVLGYIIAGVAIGPVLAALKVDVLTLQHFAEFGVVMMLFLVGLELEPRVLWKMKNKLLGLGGLQVSITIVLVSAIALAFGQTMNTAIAIGFVFALSSTAIVLQTLNEKGLMGSDGGKDSFSVLLFQDIAVIPMLAIVPLLVVPELTSQATQTGDAHHGSMSLVHGLAAWQRALVTLVAIGAVIFGGIKLSRPFFRFAASARLREILVATALLWVVGISLLMSLVELSPALGTFMAGVVLANSEYRHELESDIEPFKGLLLGLFFITVGASIDFALLFDRFSQVLGLTLGLIVLKAGVLFFLAKLFKMKGSNKWLFTLSLAQAGEFAFVLLAFAVNSHAISKELSDLLLLVVAMSMLLTPTLFIFHERFLSTVNSGTDRDPDKIEEQGDIIIAGHGRFGGVINRMLRGLGYETTVLDFNYEQLEVLKKFNFRIYYGDATRHDLLHSAGIEKAKILIIAIDDKEQITELVRHCTHQYPHLHIIARAVDRHHVYDLYSAGCRDIIRESFDSSVRAARSALEALGLHAFEAERKAKSFVQTDQRMIRELATVYKSDVPIHENKEYVEKAAKIRAENEAILRGKDRLFAGRTDRGWSPPKLSDVKAVIDEAKN